MDSRLRRVLISCRGLQQSIPLRDAFDVFGVRAALCRFVPPTESGIFAGVSTFVGIFVGNFVELFGEPWEHSTKFPTKLPTKFLGKGPARQAAPLSDSFDTSRFCFYISGH